MGVGWKIVKGCSETNAYAQYLQLIFGWIFTFCNLLSKKISNIDVAYSHNSSQEYFKEQPSILLALPSFTKAKARLCTCLFLACELDYIIHWISSMKKLLSSYDIPETFIILVKPVETNILMIMIQACIVKFNW